jgi:hypothetical protein
MFRPQPNPQVICFRTLGLSPVLAAVYGESKAAMMRNVVANIQEAVVAGSGHWLMEERPAETVALIRNFLVGDQKIALRQAPAPASSASRARKLHCPLHLGKTQ